MTLGALSEVIRIHTDAVTTYEAGTEGKEIPLGPSCFEDIEGINAHLGEDLAQFVHESDVDVTLTVLNDLSSFGNLDSRSKVGSSCDDGGIDFVNILANLWSGTGSDFLDMFYGMLLIARVDAFRRVTAIEVHVHLQAADLLYDRDALIFGHSWIYSALINHDVTL